MFDGMRYRHFFDVTSNVYIEVQDVYGDYNEIRESCARPVTSCDAACDFEFGAKNPIGRRRPLSCARYPADSDGL